MRIYLIRHGDSIDAPNDDERSLSLLGENEVKKIAEFIKPLKITVDYIYHSKKLRAVQTAEIIAKSIVNTTKMQPREDMRPMHPITQVSQEIFSANEDLLWVGHMPFLGKLASFLTTGNENYNIVNFRTGTVVCLEKIYIDQWAICWTISPELF